MKFDVKSIIILVLATVLFTMLLPVLSYVISDNFTQEECEICEECEVCEECEICEVLNDGDSFYDNDIIYVYFNNTEDFSESQDVIFIRSENPTITTFVSFIDFLVDNYSNMYVSSDLGNDAGVNINFFYLNAVNGYLEMTNVLYSSSISQTVFDGISTFYISLYAS